jgi:putative heme degradation protein
MFACIVEDATADSQNPYQSGSGGRGTGRQNQNHGASPADRRVTTPAERLQDVSAENRELKKKVKRLSLLVQESEAQRAAERLVREQYAKQCDAKATAALMEKNTTHMIELTQVGNWMSSLSLRCTASET